MRLVDIIAQPNVLRRHLGALPDVPSVAEFVPSYEANQWYGMGAPRNTPAEIVEKLNREVNVALADPAMNSRLADLGGTLFLARPPTSAS